MTTHVVVSIVGFNNAEDIVRCIRGLENSTYTDFEVVICENGGPAAYAAVVAAVPSTLSGGQSVEYLLAPRNLGFAGGVNLCLRSKLHTDAWWILNPDTIPDANALAAQIERLERGDCDAVGATLYKAGGRIQSYGGRWRRWFARAESLGIGQQLGVPIDGPAVERNQSYLNGASMLVSRRFVEIVGLMREDYFLYCEEVEWFLRSRAKGMHLGYAPAALIFHEQGTTTGAGAAVARRPKLPVYLGERNRLLVTRDSFGAWMLPWVSVSALALLFARCARAGAWRQLWYGLTGWWAGLMNEREPPRWLDV